MLTAKAVTARSRGTRLIENLTLALKPGEVMAVVGPNGAGKSTLIRLLAGDLNPASGNILLDRIPLSGWSRRDLARRRAMLPQQSRLAFPFTALEVALMGRTPHPRKPGRDIEIVRAALEVADCGNLATRRYPNLSGGERQRVQLARVLTQIWEGDRPRYLLLDEPTSALDIAHQHKILSWVRDFAPRQGVGVLVVLHDLNLAASYADRVAVLKNGSLVALGGPLQVLRAELLTEVFAWPVWVFPHPLAVSRLLVVPGFDSETGSSLIEKLDFFRSGTSA